MKLLGVQKKEFGLVGCSLLFVMFIGMIATYLCAVPLGMFLDQFEISSLAYIYVLTGGFSTALGFCLVRMERHLPFFRFLTIPILFLASAYAAFWASLMMGASSKIVAFLLFILSLTAQIVLYTVVETLLNRIFTLQQGKRLFGFIEGGAAIGGIAAGLTLPYMIALVGMHGMILVIATLFVCVYLTLRLIRKLHAKKIDMEFEEEEASEKGTRKFISLVVLAFSLAYFEYYAFDFIINEEAQKRFLSAEEIAAFFGYMWAAADFLNFVIAVGLFQWILRTFGVIASLAILPVTVIAGLGSALVARAVVGDAGWVFGLIIAARLLDESLHQTINARATLLLLQPLRADERVRASVRCECLAGPLSTMAVGLFVMAVQASFWEVSTVIIIVNVATLIALIFVQRAYVKELFTALSKRGLVKPQFLQLDKSSLAIVQKYVNSKKGAEVVYGLQVLAKIEPQEFKKSLVTALSNPDTAVQTYVLQQIEKHKVKEALPILEKLCAGVQVSGEALGAFGALGGDISKHLVNPDAASLKALLLHGKAKDEAMAILERYAKSSDAAERLIAAKVGFAKRMDLFLPLLSDKDRDVKVAATSSAEWIRDAAMFPQLIANLQDLHTHGYAFESAVAQGEALVHYIEAHFKSFSFLLKQDVIRLLGHMPGTKFLKTLLHKDARLLPEVSRSLRLHNYKAESKREIYKLIEECCAKIDAKRRMHAKLKEVEAPLLRDLLSREIAIGQECIYALLTTLYPKEMILSAEQGMKSKDEELTSYATELLLKSLSSSDSKKILPRLVATDVKPSKRSVEEILTELLEKSKQFYIPSIASAAAYTIRSLKLLKLEPLIQKVSQTDDPYFSEFQM